jgi:hypothetical protein
MVDDSAGARRIVKRFEGGLIAKPNSSWSRAGTPRTSNEHDYLDEVEIWTPTRDFFT